MNRSVWIGMAVMIVDKAKFSQIDGDSYFHQFPAPTADLRFARPQG